MIKVNDIVKSYDGHVAVDHLSFTIEDGKVIGFLGPNGAGKSTVMNIITGYISATEGSVIVDGHDILEEPEEAKKAIGYLPEIPPVYPEMTVEEYLDFCAELKGVAGSEVSEQVKRALNLTRTADVAGRLIKHLSKGYRQRVGLAEALLGNPKTLILDEPTVGLDPKQIIEMRQLVRSLAADHTVLISSHILSEIAAICDEVIIINKGHLVAEDTPDNLSKKMQDKADIELEVIGEEAHVRKALDGIEGITDIIVDSAVNGHTKLRLTTDENDPREAVFRACVRNDLPIIEMHLNARSLEEIFIELTENREVKKRRKILSDASEIAETKEDGNESDI